jgi:hypothetical protein
MQSFAVISRPSSPRWSSGGTASACQDSSFSEFERYLGCGILANGFARVRCASCHDEMLVAYGDASRKLGDAAGADAAVGSLAAAMGALSPRARPALDYARARPDATRDLHVTTQARTPGRRKRSA